jgi:predicted P-loop ATPase
LTATNVTQSYLTINPKLPAVIPEGLRSLRRWTAWARLKPKREGDKPGKKPLSATNDATSWLAFDAALAAAQGKAGVGFQMMGASTLIGVDIDRCLDEDGVPTELAAAILASVPDTYAEVTPSGTGLRLFLQAVEGRTVPEFLNREAGVEVYVGKSARFLTVTGHVLPGREGLLGEVTPAFCKLVQPLALKDGVVDLEIKLEVPPVQRVQHWQHLFESDKLAFDDLPRDLQTFLTDGDVPGSRSERTFGVATRLIESRTDLDTIFAILISAPGPWEAALDKRDQDEKRARELLWADIGRAQKLVRAEQRAEEDRAGEWARLGLRVEIVKKRAVVVQSQINAVRLITNYEKWAARVALDVTTGVVLLDGTPMDDGRFFQLQEEVCAFAGWPPNMGRAWWADAVRAAAERCQVNPRAVWLRAMKWDGKPRLDRWLVDHVAQEDNPLNRVLGRKWLISLVARWLEPGCKCDTVLVLAGTEGTRKTTFFELMAGGPERVVMLQGFERDDRFTAAKAWLVEIPEAHLFKRADRNRLKAFVTERVDQYRPPYAANPVVVKRGFVLVSTTNETEMFAADQDGLRRFWPVWVRDSQINLKWIEEKRDQLLAEAVVAYDLEEPWWFETQPAELTQRVREAVETSTVDDALAALVVAHAGKGGLTLTEIVSEVTTRCGFRPHERSVAGILARHGIYRKRTTTQRYWMHPSWESTEGSNVLPFPEIDKALVDNVK